MPGKLYVGNLAFSVSDEQLSDLFASSNIAVDSVRVVRDMDTGRSRGFAFVELTPEGDLANAIKELNGKVLDGRPLTVSEARPQKKRDFGGRGGIHEVHFRNVSSPLPDFVECFPDDGYVDMYQVMKALREVRFKGAAVPDHVPELAGDTGIRRAGKAYCIACMRSYLRRANQEVG